MTVSNSWLVAVNVNINTTTPGTFAFNNSMLVGVMPTQSSPYQSPPASWSGNLYQQYSSLSSFETDFAPLIAGATTQGDLYQLERFMWLQNDVAAYFAQTPTPANVYVAAMPPQQAAHYSTCVVQLTTSGAVTIPAGTVVTPKTATSSYVLLEPFVAGSASTFNVTFYSIDVTTAISASTFTAISPAIGAVTGVANSAGATLNIAGTPTNYVTMLQAIINQQNGFYSMKICDQILVGAASGYGTCVVEITTSGALTIPKGTTVTPETATAYYTALQSWTLPQAGIYSIPFFSTDGATAIPVNTFTTLAPVVSGATVSGNLAAITAIPGFSTASTGVFAALTNFRSLTNQKMLFQDTNDPTIAGALTGSSGNKDCAFFYHSGNLQAPTGYIGSTQLSNQTGAAAMGEYFTDLFQLGVGLKPISSMQLAGQTVDPTITTSNIGDISQAGSSTNLIGWNNNVYGGVGAPPGIGLVQYGTVSASNSSSNPLQIVYIDQVVGATYLQFVAQANLVAYIIAQQPTGGVPYSDYGIQQILNNFKGSVQQAVAQNILQSPPNSAYVYYTYAQVQALDPSAIGARIYRDLTFNGEFLSRIQRISLTVNLSL